MPLVWPWRQSLSSRRDCGGAEGLALTNQLVQGWSRPAINWGPVSWVPAPLSPKAGWFRARWGGRWGKSFTEKPGG